MVRNHDPAHPGARTIPSRAGSVERNGWLEKLGPDVRYTSAAFPRWKMHDKPCTHRRRSRSPDARARNGCTTSIRVTCTTAKAAARFARSANRVIERDWYELGRGSSPRAPARLRSADTPESSQDSPGARRLGVRLASAGGGIKLIRHPAANPAFDRRPADRLISTFLSDPLAILVDASIPTPRQPDG